MDMLLYYLPIVLSCLVLGLSAGFLAGFLGGGGIILVPVREGASQKISIAKLKKIVAVFFVAQNMWRKIIIGE